MTNVVEEAITEDIPLKDDLPKKIETVGEEAENVEKVNQALEKEKQD